MLFLLRWLSRRPLSHLHAIGAFLGWVVYALSPSYRRRLRANAQRAGITPAQRRQSVAEAGKMVMEGLRLWLRPPDQPIADPVHWEGEQLIDEALALGRGLVFLTPHMGSFEITAQAYAQRYGAQQPITVMYRPARYRMLRELEETARARPALATAPATIGGVRQMMRALQARRGGGPAARPGAARRHGRVGRLLRRAGLHHDAGGAAGAAVGRADRAGLVRAAAGRARLPPAPEPAGRAAAAAGRRAQALQRRRPRSSTARWSR